MKKYRRMSKDEPRADYPPKAVYKISDELRIMLQADETEEECDAYFADLELCKELQICADCGEPVEFNEEYRKEHIKEYSISALCVKCQEKAFGI